MEAGKEKRKNTGEIKDYIVADYIACLITK